MLIPNIHTTAFLWITIISNKENFVVSLEDAI